MHLPKRCGRFWLVPRRHAACCYYRTFLFSVAAGTALTDEVSLQPRRYVIYYVYTLAAGLRHAILASDKRRLFFGIYDYYAEKTIRRNNYRDFTLIWNLANIVR